MKNDKLSEDFELWLCSEILKLRSLHYGYWANPVETDKIDLDEIRKAQLDYTDTLLAMIPQDVGSILDVGCGIGDISFALSDLGYRVSAISPDRFHRDHFKDRSENGVTFYNIRFEDFQPQKKYDLVLMSESQAYFDVEEGLIKSAKSLRQEGYLLVSGNFRQHGSAPFKDCPVYSDYRNTADKQGFEVLSELDISQNVLPTLDYANAVVGEYILPAVLKTREFLTEKNGLKFSLMKFLLRKETYHLERLEKFYSERLDPELYRRYAVYKRVLMKKRG